MTEPTESVGESHPAAADPLPADDNPLPAGDRATAIPDGRRPLVRAGLRGFLDLTRVDVLTVVLLVILAFALRVLSPIVLDVGNQNGNGPPVQVLGVGAAYNSDPHACKVVPVPPDGHDASVCGQVFDEVYFPTDAANDLGRYQPTSCPQKWDPTNCQPRDPAVTASDSAGAECQRHPDAAKCAVSAVSYFDPEPPLTKLMMAPSIRFLGFTTTGWRMSQVVFGSLLVGLVYLIALRLRRDRFFATAAALFVCLDGLAFVESRTGVIDIIAVFFAALFSYTFLLHWQARTRRQWRVTCYAMAIAGGLAFAAKITALAPALVVASMVLVRLGAPLLGTLFPALHRLSGPRRHETILWKGSAGRRWWFHYGVGVLLVGIIFCCSFARFLTVPHQDVFRFIGCDPKAGLTTASPPSDSLQVPVTTVAGIKVLDPVTAVRNIVDTTSAELQYHSNECHGHPYASRWYTWPAMTHPVLFYASYAPLPDKSPGQASITNMGNPALWWPGVLALLFCIWRMLGGPMALRATVGALGVISTFLMIVTFRAGEQPIDPSTLTQPGPVHLSILFGIAFLGVGVFCGFGVLGAVISRRFVPAFIVLGYYSSWMLWVVGNAQRVLFFYHALQMMVFTALALAYALTTIRRQVVTLRSRAGRTRFISLAPVSYAAVALAVAAFVFFYPIWTAIPQAPADHQMRIWVDTG